MPQWFDTEGVTEAMQFPDLTMEDMLFRFRDEISQHRYNEELQGTITYEGMNYPINKESIYAMDSRILSMTDEDTINWKSKDGYVILTKAQLTTVCNLCKDAVQALYDKESAIYELINAETYMDDDNMDDVWNGYNN